MSDLKIEISADIGNVKQQVAAVSKELEELGKDAATATTALDKISPVTAKLQTSLAKTAVSAAKVDSSLDKLKGATNSAGQSLQNVGRIAQDLPFGFIGIQNNLNPLLESFQRLKAETGSSSKALKAMAGSLMGVGGIGLALSVVSAAVLIYQNGIAGFNKKTKEAKDHSKDFAESLKDVETSGIATGIQLQNFANIAKDTTQSLTTRNEALLQANKILGDHGEKLTLVNIATAAATEQINKFTEATIQQALASKFSDRAANLIISQRDAIKDYTKALAEQKKVSNLPVNPLDEFAQANNAALNAVKSKTKDAAGAYKLITKDLGEMRGALSDAQIQAAKLFGELGRPDKKDKLDKAKKDVETISDVLIKLGREIALLNEQEFILGANESKAKISAIESAIHKLVTDFKVSPKDTIIQKLFGDINALKPGIEKITIHPELIDISPKKILLDKAAAEKALNDSLGKADIKPVKIPLEVTADFFAEQRKKILDFAAFATETFSTSIVGSFEQLGKSIGDALTGGSDAVGGFFGGIASLLAQSLKDLGKYIIQSSALIATIRKSLNAAFAGNPVLGIAAGIGLIAIGTALQNAIPKFAGGVQNFGGGLAMVGERGPEMVRLPRGSDVIPNHRLNGIGGDGITVNIIGTSVLRGQDVYTQWERAGGSRGRNG